MELQLQHQSFHEYAGLISFRIDLFDLLAVQGTLKSLHMIYLFLAALGLHCCRFFLVATSGSYSLLQRTGFSSWWLLFVAELRLWVPGFSSGSTQACNWLLLSC